MSTIRGKGPGSYHRGVRTVKRIAIYGKGGSGKSTVSCALSCCYARQGLKVLQVGCDPKADSTLALTEGKRITTLLDLLAEGKARPKPAEFVVEGRHGIDCIEAGGPAPGAGCGGRGIARMFELFEELDFLPSRNYDVVIFDVLGDVVCGGFAAPLRYGFAERAFVVVSGDPLSLFAANNIILAANAYYMNGVRLGGLITNVFDDETGGARINAYARSIGTGLAGVIPRDPAVGSAAGRYRTAVEIEGGGATVQAFENLAGTVLDSFDVEPGKPAPLTSDEVFALFSGSVRGSEEPPVPRPAEEIPPPASEVAHPVITPPGPRRSLPRDGLVLGGPEAREGLAAMLGFNSGARAPLALEVLTFGHRAGAFLVSVKSPSIGSLEFSLAPEKQGQSCYAVAGGWAVSHTSKLTPVARQLLDYVVKRVRRLSPSADALALMITGDPASRLAGELERVKDAGRPRDRRAEPRFWSVWGAGGKEGRFLYGQERIRMLMGVVRFGGGRTFNVHHSSDVCQFSEQKITPYSAHMLRFPWLNERAEDTHHEQADWLTSNLNECDFIAGSNDALRRALAVAGEAGERFVAASIYVSCSPVIAGEDWTGAIREFTDGFDGPVLISGVAFSDATEDIIRAARETLDKVPAEASGEIVALENAVHLVGFPPGRGVKELFTLMEGVGLQLGQRQLPLVDLAGLVRYGEAPVQLLWPQAAYTELYKGLYEKLAPAVVHITPPYGVCGVEEFLRQGLAAVGLEPDSVEETLAEELNRARLELARLAPRAGRHRVGIALAEAQGDLVTRPELTSGVPLASFLEELGFRVEILSGSDDERRLNWWLGSGLSAVCTDLSFDRRLLQRGIGQFGIADLEPGLQGAVRSQARVLGACEAEFARNLSRFKAATGDGDE